MNLDPTGDPVVLDGGVTLRTPGLAGAVESFPRKQLGVPHLSNDFLEALTKANVRAQAIIQMSSTEEQPDAVADGSAPIKTIYGEDALELKVGSPGFGWGQFVIETDESGAMTWNFPKPANGSPAAPSDQTYLLRSKVAGVPAAAPDAALTGVPGSKAIHVLNFPWSPIGVIASDLVGLWEKVNRPYRVRTFTPQNYQAKDVPEFVGPDWDGVAGNQKSLLIVHGTLSQAHTDFGRFPAEFVARMNKSYEGRVFAFDHPTLVDDPEQNAQWFINAMPYNTTLNLDIVCHSRGGLVSRVLSEKMTGALPGNRKVTVDKLVFIATPNAGTVLTDTDRLGNYLESYTNMLSFEPVNGVKEILEVLINIGKLIAGGVAAGLRGLESMRPEGDFLNYLNDGTAGNSHYFALASNFEPLGEADTGRLGLSSDRIDEIFNQQWNDSIVPTNGVWQGSGTGYFPIDKERVVLRGDPGGAPIDHGGFFQDETSQEAVASWLGV